MARKILLADDSVTAQNMGRKILTDAGYEVVTVNNGSAALKKIFEVKPDLVVLDVYMPGYSGLEVCQRIKENKDSSRIPILLTVGKLEPFKPEEARRVRADAFVVKPFEASELLAALARLEDKIVPQAEPYKQGRFAKAVAAVDDQVNVDKDETWKARLRIPTGGPKPEPEAESEAAPPAKSFRDFHSEEPGKHEPKREGVFERPMPAGVPADITPEEIAAIAAAAAQLKGGTAPARATEPSEPSPVVTADVAAGKVSDPAREEQSPVTFASAPQGPEPPVGSSLAQSGDASSNAQSQPEPVSTAVANESSTSGENTVVAEPVPTAAEQSSAASLVAASPVSETSAAASTEAAATSVTRTSEPVVAESTTSSPTAANPVAEPADDEVMAALQSLMPAETAAESVPATRTPETSMAPPALSAIVAEVDSAMLKAHAAGPRWIAEEVVLADHEAHLSLEREMEQAYAAVAASGTVLSATAAPVSETSAAPIPIGNAVQDSASVASNDVRAAEPAAVYAMAAGATESATVAAPAAEHLAHNDLTPQEQASAISETSTRVNDSPSPGNNGPSPSALPEPQSVTHTQISGGVEDMAASWKNIRDSIATGGAVKAAPAKEQEEIPSSETAHSELDAAASVAQGPAPSPASDPKAIASIVDSVLAELRPKIVEEIARKLADTKKE